MKLFVTGGTGLIARRFIDSFPDYDVTVLTRNIVKAQGILPRRITLVENMDKFSNLDGFDGVINLAGEPIIDHRWTLSQKIKICESRWLITQKLVELINAGNLPPKVFLSGSAIGIYGDQNDTVLDEESETVIPDFASDLCLHWEHLANQVNKATRCVNLRTGIVLDRSGGALAKMILPYKLFLGGKLGNGAQYMSWIHIDDMVQALNYLLLSEVVDGAVNLVAPNSVKNVDFSKSLAANLKRVAVLPVPKLFLKTMLGESSSLLLGSQRVTPKKLLDNGFKFRYPDLKVALADLV
jgi:uncharacterized protein (TIGR01777 family)